MKVDKKGEIKLDRWEVRAGNFVMRYESDGHLRVGDLGGYVSFRVSDLIAKGEMLRIVWEQAKNGTEQEKARALVYLEKIAVVTFNYLSCVPDQALLDEVNEAVVRCVERNKAIYGVREDISDEQNEKDIEQFRGEYEAVEEVFGAKEGE